jgi:hypothetical protein
LVYAGAPGTIQTVLTPGNYVALNITGNGQPAFEQFKVTVVLARVIAGGQDDRGLDRVQLQGLQRSA